jgi:GNAT superfamily N-acetyltransferase
MSDARQYFEKETLANGLEVCIRASRPDDLGRVIEAFRELDPESVYLRYFGPKKDFSATELRNFREADFNTRVILLCTILREQREVVIAAATYVRVGEAAAEVAFVVEEDYHRLGIARRMLQHLGRIATAAGIKTFVAEVLPYNTSMLGLFGRCGWPIETKTEDGTVHVTLTLNKP